MAKAGSGRGPGVALAVVVGGPALALWAAWALVLCTIVYSAVVATQEVAKVSKYTVDQPVGGGAAGYAEG